MANKLSRAEVEKAIAQEILWLKDLIIFCLNKSILSDFNSGLKNKCDYCE